jgi:hypothetical protein
MSKKNQTKREAYAKKQEEKGKKVIMWIIGILIAFGLVFAITTSLSM